MRSPLFGVSVDLDIPYATAETDFLSAREREPHIACPHLSEVGHRTAGESVLPFVGKELPSAAVGGSLDEVAVILRGIFKLRHHRLYLDALSQVYLEPLLPERSRPPECSIVVIHGIVGPEVGPIA